MPVHIRISRFEGPLELLLSLIEERRLSITEVSLSEVADQYLAVLARERENISLENLASFLVIASRLILIKSKTLLPVLEITEEEEEAIEDLEARLLEYKRFREAAERLAVLLGKERCSFPRPKLLGAPETYVPPCGVTVDTLRKHFGDVLGEIPTKEEIVEETIREVVSLEERIADLQASLRRRTETSFREMLSKTEDRMETVVSFLAVLELVKRRFVAVDQKDAFGDICIVVTEREETDFF